MALRFYTEEQLGPTRSLTPEGFLVCRGVPVARTGTLLYAPGEVPVDPGKDGIISISRDPDDVFDEKAIASFNGKPVTNDHPPLGIKVDPSNWRQLAIGDVQNVHRGTGGTEDDQFLYADLVIKDAAAIQDVMDGKKEVSAGYDAEYEQLEPGRGRQRDIIGNHVALVDKGRCGPRCAIGDNDTMPKNRAAFIDKIKAAFYSRDEGALVSELAKVPDMMGDIVSDDMPPGMNLHIHTGSGGGAAAMPSMPSSKGPMSVGQDEAPDDGAGAGGAAGGMPPGGAAAGGGGDVMAMMQQIMERLQTLEQAVMLLAQDDGDEGADPDDGAAPAAAAPDDTAPGKVDDDAAEMGGEQKTWPNGNAGSVEDRARRSTGDRRATVGDSTSLGGTFQDMISKAAVLAPGHKLPVFDAARSARLTTDAMCNYRRLTLARAWGTTDGREVIGRLYQSRKPDFSRDAMTCDAATILFNGAAALAGASNTRDASRGFAAVMDHGREVSSGAPKTVSIADINTKAREMAAKGWGNRN